MKKIVIVFLGLFALAAGYYLVSPLWRNVELHEGFPDDMDAETKAEFERQMEEMKGKSVEMTEAMPGQVLVLAEGEMVPVAHDVKGRAMLIDTPRGRYLRFEDLETVNGPDLRIYLAADTDAKDFVDLGPIRATRGSVNYALPPNTDTAKYHIALIWCRAFRVLFSYADMR